MADSGIPFDLVSWIWLLIKLAVGILLTATALTGFHLRKLHFYEITARLVAAVMLFAPGILWDQIGISLAIFLWGWHLRHNLNLSKRFKGAKQ
ncbi:MULTISPECIES: DUF3394 domain-containing protein [Marinomonas]|uniref:DUF3394 domain-containing protein n=1 Tax=Marinomonas rhodophyticola TaxID=2992803 RepID=A0ABT3KBJ2_9GAMM|nr:DUF3394 domain-containing protein [Marinomonas sp. KJ51-3]MCW4627844.1 DUF3394 domain-containing protein [Marinomonas sp. KJ51-3]